MTYTYTYNFQAGGNQSETVGMQLEQGERDFLVAGARNLD